MWSKLPQHASWEWCGQGKGWAPTTPTRPAIVDDPATSEARPPRRAWGVLAVASYGQFAFSAYLLGIGAAAPVLQRQYGHTLAQVSILLGAANLGPLLCALAWGVVTDRFGERWAMTVGLTVSAFLLALVSTATTF